MRRTREEAAETRRRAVETASRLYRERGLDAVSVADVMITLPFSCHRYFSIRSPTRKGAAFSERRLPVGFTSIQ